MADGKTEPVILLLGGNGRLGRYCQMYFSDMGKIVLAPSGCGWDTALLAELFKKHQPDMVINTVAWTGVDLAEQQPEKAANLNTTLPQTLADLCLRHGSFLVHFSTDYVFGNPVMDAPGMRRPWTEADRPFARSVYGQTKLKGEIALLNSQCRCVIFRIGWLYDERDPALERLLCSESGDRSALSWPGPGDFIDAILQQRHVATGHSCQTAPIRVVANQYGTPSAAGWVARNSAEAVRCLYWSGAADAADITRDLWHLAPAGGTSRADYAQTILDIAAHFENTRPPAVVPIILNPALSTPGVAARPEYSILNGNALRERMLACTTLADWQQDWQNNVQTAVLRRLSVGH